MRFTAERLRDASWLARCSYIDIQLFMVSGDWESARKLSDISMNLYPEDPIILGQQLMIEAQTGNASLVHPFWQRLQQSMEAQRTEISGLAGVQVYLALAPYISNDVEYLDLAQSETQRTRSQTFAAPLRDLMAQIGRAHV
jgi:hypothetical protein